MGWSLREHQKEPDRLAHLLYWQALLDPDGDADIITQSDCSLLSTLRYAGADTESASPAEKQTRCAQFHAWLMGLPAGWGLHAEIRRRHADPYPQRRWSHPVAALVDVECEAQAQETHFETDYTLTLTQHLRGLGPSWKRLLWANIPEAHSLHAPARQFREEVTRLGQDLSGVFPAVEFLRGDALLTYLKSTISLTRQAVGIPDPPWFLASSLSDMGYTPGAVPQLGDAYLRVITVRNNLRTGRVGYPATTSPGMLDVLQDLPMEYRAVWRWLPLSPAQADTELNAYENFYLQKGKSLVSGLLERATGSASRKRNHAADDAAADVAEARRLLHAGTVCFGYGTTSILVWDADYQAVEAKRTLIEDTMRAARFTVSAETWHSTEAWLGMVPGDCYHNVRRPLLDSCSMARQVPTTSVSAGAKWVPHLQGGPWIIGTAQGQTPYGLTTHHGDVGDFYLVGPKGSGKSAKLAFLCLQWLQYGTPDTPAQVRAFDMGGSLLCATAAVGGSWMDLTPGQCPPLQPLASIDQEAEATWALEWVGDLLALEHITMDQSVRREVFAALRSLALFPPQRRTLSGLCGLLQQPRLREALHLYTREGAYGSLLDGDCDPLPTSAWQCFELGGLLKLPRILPLVMTVVFRSLRRQFDGRPTLIPLDECWAYFHVEAMEARMLEYLKTVRRLNGTMGFLTQELFDLHQSHIAEAIFNACQARIYCANPNVLAPEPAKIYAGYGLTETQRAIIASLTPARDYYYTSPRHGHRRYRLALGPIAQAFCGRSRIEDLARIREVQATATEPFAVAWLRQEGLHDAAQLLAETYDTQETQDAQQTMAQMVTGGTVGTDAWVVG